MRVTLPLVLLLLSPLAYASRTCQPENLPSPALRLIKPLMELRIKQSQDQFTAEGRWKGESSLTPEIEKRFEAVLDDRTKAGDQALAYLLTVYMGEHHGEELVCEVTNRGRRMLPLIDAYAACAPVVGFEPLPKFVHGSGALPEMAKKGVLSGKKCRYED